MQRIKKDFDIEFFTKCMQINRLKKKLKKKIPNVIQFYMERDSFSFNQSYHNESIRSLVLA